MAVYKVIQDIEAEDKLIGPLTLKGFIYAATAVLLGFINFRLLTSSALGPLKWLFILTFFLPMILFAVLASPLGREQPTEVWLLARIRFLLKPRERIWNQLGIQNLVIITAAKKEERQLVKDLSQTEVASRLQALAQTLDSHGWAIKNSAVNLATSPTFSAPKNDDSDRLVTGTTTDEPQAVVDVHPADDILDEQNNPTAQKFEDMMLKADELRKFELQQKLEQARTGATLTSEYSQADQDPDGNTQAMLDAMHERAKFYSSDAVTPKPQTVKLELANAGNALSIASVAKLANQATGGEVVVPLH